MMDAGSPGNMEKELKPIRYLSETYPRVCTLMNRVNVESLWDAHIRQEKGKAVGIDMVTKAEYGKNLEENLNNLVDRMKTLKYKPQAVRRTYIPKANGKKRPLGIPAYEDKLVQAVMAGELSELYEVRFLNCSYGFRPGKGAHDVVKLINDTIMTKHVNYVLEADIKGFFDNVDQKWLVKFLEHDISDKTFIRYIVRFLKAGIMEDGEWRDSEKGTPQGGLISPVLANVYLHYVLDLWIERWVKKQFHGEVYYVRYADDFLLLFQVKKEAEQCMDMLSERLGKFGLQLAEDKTRILPIGRFNKTKESFDFLGFTFFDTKTRNDKYRIGVRTCAKKLKVKMADLKSWIRKQFTEPLEEVFGGLNLKLKV